MIEHLLRAACLLDMPTVHDDDVIGHLEGFFLVVGYEQGRDRHFVMELAQPLPEFLADLGIQGTERLVEEQTAGSAARARARATRCRCPPDI